MVTIHVVAILAFFIAMVLMHYKKELCRGTAH
jgi:hypothetical protein